MYQRKIFSGWKEKLCVNTQVQPQEIHVDRPELLLALLMVMWEV